MTMPQAARIAELLRKVDRNDPVEGWLATLEESSSDESSLADATVRALIDRARPRWGVRTPEDAEAYLGFWSRLIARHDDPRLVAAYADVVGLLGGARRHCEALAIFVRAVFRSPDVFIEHAADFVDVAAGCGRQAQVELELAKVAYYAWLVEQGELEGRELRETVREVLAMYGDDETLRDRLRVLARGLIP